MPFDSGLCTGVTFADMIELVRSGLAAAICDRVVEDRLKVIRMRLTDAGRRVLEKARRCQRGSSSNARRPHPSPANGADVLEGSFPTEAAACAACERDA